MHSETIRQTATTSRCLATCNCSNRFVWLCCGRLYKILYMVIITPMAPCECGCDPPNFGSKILTQHHWHQLDKRKIIRNVGIFFWWTWILAISNFFLKILPGPFLRAFNLAILGAKSPKSLLWQMVKRCGSLTPICLHKGGCSWCRLPYILLYIAVCKICTVCGFSLHYNSIAKFYPIWLVLLMLYCTATLDVLRHIHNQERR